MQHHIALSAVCSGHVHAAIKQSCRLQPPSRLLYTAWGRQRDCATWVKGWDLFALYPKSLANNVWLYIINAILLQNKMNCEFKFIPSETLSKSTLSVFFVCVRAHHGRKGRGNFSRSPLYIGHWALWIILWTLNLPNAATSCCADPQS